MLLIDGECLLENNLPRTTSNQAKLNPASSKTDFALGRLLIYRRVYSAVLQHTNVVEKRAIRRWIGHVTLSSSWRKFFLARNLPTLPSTRQPSTLNNCFRSQVACFCLLKHCLKSSCTMFRSNSNELHQSETCLTNYQHWWSWPCLTLGLCLCECIFCFSVQLSVFLRIPFSWITSTLSTAVKNKAIRCSQRLTSFIRERIRMLTWV
jgi:hypothetical protein